MKTIANELRELALHGFERDMMLRAADALDRASYDAAAHFGAWKTCEVSLAEANTTIKRLRAENEALRGACRMVLMLRQLGGMLPGTHEVVQSVVDAVSEALEKEQRP